MEEKLKAYGPTLFRAYILLFFFSGVIVSLFEWNPLILVAVGAGVLVLRNYSKTHARMVKVPNPNHTPPEPGFVLHEDQVYKDVSAPGALLKRYRPIDETTRP